MPWHETPLIQKMRDALAVAKEYLLTLQTLNSERTHSSCPQDAAQLSRAADATFDAWKEQMKKFEELRDEYERTRPKDGPGAAPGE